MRPSVAPGARQRAVTWEVQGAGAAQHDALPGDLAVMARLGWLVLGAVFGALGGWVASRRGEDRTQQPVVAAATRLPLEATVPPPSRTAVPDATTPDATTPDEPDGEAADEPDAEAPPAPTVAEHGAHEGGTAPSNQGDTAPSNQGDTAPSNQGDTAPSHQGDTAPPRPTPSPRPRPDRPGRHAWVSPEDEAPGSAPA